MGYPTYRFALTFALTVGGIAACGGGADSAGPGDEQAATAGASTETSFDTIDAAMLFPLDPANMLKLGPAAKSNGNVTLVTQDQFAQALTLTEAKPIVLPKYETWSIVAFRFDPRAASSPTATDFKTTIRLVAQPLDDGGSAIDDALHLIYVLPAGEDAAIVKELAAAKAQCQKALGKATNGTPLGIHPCLALPEAKRKPFRDAIFATILRHASSDKLAAVSAMFNPGTTDNWHFGASVVRADKLVQVPIPSLIDPSGQDPAHPEAIHQTFSDALGAIFNPNAPRNGDIHPKANAGFDQLGDTVNEIAVSRALAASPPSLDAIKAGMRASIRIENPAIHDVLSPKDSVSCADCHMASRARSNVQKHLPSGMKMSDFDLTTDAFVPPAKTTARLPKTCGPTAKPNEACLLPDDTNYVVKAFAYHGKQMAIIPRVANEAAHVADVINRELLPKASK